MTFKPNPKPKTYQNERYLNHIRGKPCSVIGCHKSYNKHSHPHHVRRSYWGAGTSKKPHDYVAIPLCYLHHTPKIERKLDINAVIIKNMIEYIKAYDDDNGLKLIDTLMQHIEDQKRSNR